MWTNEERSCGKLQVPSSSSQFTESLLFQVCVNELSYWVMMQPGFTGKFFVQVKLECPRGADTMGLVPQQGRE